MGRALGGIAFARQQGHSSPMTKRSTKRPKAFTKPAHWSSAPPPQPEPAKDGESLSPTRYGDWVRNGIAIDF